MYAYSAFTDSIWTSYITAVNITDATMMEFWIQQRNQPSPLNIGLANVQVLNNKLDKLRTQIKHQKLIKNCCDFAFTETWLEPSVPPELFTRGDILALNAMCNVISDSENSKPEAAFIV